MRCAKCGSERPLDGPCSRCLSATGPDSHGPGYEQIGPYRIVSRLGSGGMGEVYRAHDDRLGRSVAIKVLPETLAGDPERIARFRREARLAASFNHPNIASIYGFEEIEGKHFLVMELVEGRSLADRLQSGPMPIDETISVVAQIAEGLEAAHERGVVHRDLKPSNVMLLPDGKVKILDFGLAKALDAEPPALDIDHSPTMSVQQMQHTTPGAVIGTVPYMSPEQARGRPVDRRTDIWSLGCVLYECLTGRRAFDGETATDILAKILERDPSWEALPARTPARVRELVERCLEKDPRHRIRDSGDVRIELERARVAREWSSSGAVAAARPASWRSRGQLLWGIAGLAVGIAVMAVTMRTFFRLPGAGQGARPRGASALPLKVDVTDPAIPAHPALDHSSVAVSADGMTIAYFGKATQTEGAAWSICLRRADDVHAIRCVDSPDPFDPFFSPDGAWMGFSSLRGVYKVSLAGGAPTRVAEPVSVGATKGAAWTEKGIVFSPAAKAGLMIVSEQGGTVQTLTVPDASKGEVSHRWPSALPDGRHLLFTIKKEGITSFDQGEIALLDLDTKSWKTLIRGGSFARYLPTGHIVYARDGAILAVPFDLRSGEVRGTPVTVLAGVMTQPGSGAAQFAVASEAGALVFVPGGPDIQRDELVWLDRRGNVTPVGAPLEHYYAPFLSPDGTRVAATVFGATDTVVVFDLTRGSSVRAKTVGNCQLRGWYPDGRRLLVASDAEGGGTMRLYETPADGSGTARRVGVDDLDGAGAWIFPTAGGVGIVHRTEDGLYVTRIEGEPLRRRITDFGEVTPRYPSVSPDGRWIAYETVVSGVSEVYVRPFPTGERKWQVSRGGGRNARWSPRGDELIYRRDSGGESWLVSVRMSTTATAITADPPKDLVKLPVDLTELNASGIEGERFLAVRRAAPQFAGDRVVEILNWFEQVEAKAPSR
ncbi:MAG TPA: protein kinase [Candidatus Polarisedimenticolaceae bacterium]|nr:protein kinase [Candidatus Polarisedimenticolaceae bacterium]